MKSNNELRRYVPSMIFYVRDGMPFVRNHMDGGNYTESNDRIIPIEK
ncbi:hypothetical protein GPK89_03720 [Gemmiger formicilis]|nr:hypothetical protein [Gemmiger formicilis]MBT9673841.1 hypothetical protein [Gemmiger formicilis]